jgi:hypothetical protein
MIARLSAYSRSISIWRVLASAVRRIARLDNSLTINELMRNAKNETRFPGSEILHDPTGGRKK